MKYLITGITGFAGAHLAKLLLKKGHEVHGIVRTANGREQDLLDIMKPEELNSIKFHYCDLKHYFGVREIVKDNEFDGIHHLAAMSHPPTSFIDPILTFQENIISTVNLITAIELSDTVFHYCSTSEIFGDTGKTELFESDPYNPVNPYAVSKAAMDMYVQERIRNGYLKGFITRAFSHTGSRRGKIFSISSDAYQIVLMELGKQKIVLKTGNLNTVRTVMDVRDCVRAYYLLMQNIDKSKDVVFNICGNNPHKMEYFTDKLIALSTVKSIKKVIYRPYYRKHDIQYQYGNTERIHSFIDWKQEIPIDKTLEDLLNYWRKKLSQ